MTETDFPIEALKLPVDAQHIIIYISPKQLNWILLESCNTALNYIRHNKLHTQTYLISNIVFLASDDWYSLNKEYCRKSITCSTTVPAVVKYNTDFIFVTKSADHDVVYPQFFAHKYRKDEYNGFIKRACKGEYDTLVIDCKTDKLYYARSPKRYLAYFIALIHLKLWINKFLQRFYCYDSKGYYLLKNKWESRSATLII